MKSLLISHCLLGEKVRYDGDHCSLRADYIARLKSKYKLIFICPEVMAGMGVPRAPIELKDGKIINQEGRDLTQDFDPVKVEIKKLIDTHSIEYALLKEESPSCGKSRVYSGDFDGVVIEGTGLIADFCLSLGLQVFNEEEVSKLL